MKTPAHLNVGAPLLRLVAASFALGGAVRDRQPAVPPPGEYTTLVGTYCIGCHNDKLKTTGLSLQTIDLSDVPAQAAVWEKLPSQQTRSSGIEPARTFAESLRDRLPHAAPEIFDRGPGPTPSHDITVSRGR